MAIEWEIVDAEGNENKKIATRIDGDFAKQVAEFEDGVLKMYSGCGKYALPLRKKLKANNILITECINPDPPVQRKKKVKPQVKQLEPSGDIYDSLGELDEGDLPEYYSNKPSLAPMERLERSKLIDKRKRGIPMTKAEDVAYKAMQIGLWPWEEIKMDTRRMSGKYKFAMNIMVAQQVVEEPYPSKENSPEGDISWQYGNKSPKAKAWILRNLGQEEHDRIYTGIAMPVVDGSFEENMGYDPNWEDKRKAQGLPKEIQLPSAL